MNKIIASALFCLFASVSPTKADYCLEVGQAVVDPTGRSGVIQDVVCDPNLLESYTVLYDDGSTKNFEEASGQSIDGMPVPK